MNTINISESKKSIKNLLVEIFMLAGIILFLILDFVFCAKCNYMTMRTKAVMSLAVEMCSIGVCGFLYFSGFIDERKTGFRKLFLELVFFIAFAFFLDSIYWFTAKKPEYDTILIIDNALLYLCQGIIFILFWGCEINIMNLKAKMPKAVMYSIRVFMLIYIAAVLLNIKFGFFYTIHDGNFIRNPKTGHSEGLLPFIVCLALLFYAIKVKTLIRIKIPFIVMAILPILSTLIQNFFYFSWILYVSLLIATFVLYINVQVNLNNKVEEFRNKVMISQIQPHFMYNTLTTIKALCRIDPDLASKTITNFADYLRGNMDFAGLEATIPVEKELKHTQIYTEIESLRFDNITFEYKIEDNNFEIPALCIQPMVENAVRHGVRSQKDGHILIHTFEDDKFHNIIIQDNGKGFDNTQFNGSRTHIGLLNTRLRIERLVNGTFEVQSVPGKGVKITMRIPK